MFADDCVLNAKTEEKMQHQVHIFLKACDNFGLTISVKKTEVLFQPEPGKQKEELNVFVKDQKLPAVENFTYLGSTLSQKANIDLTTELPKPVRHSGDSGKVCGSAEN